MSQIVVIFHRADFDGLFCREIAKKALGTDGVTYIGWDYGDPVPKVSPDEDLYMLDISVEGLMDHPNLVWIDHHKTAIEKYGKRPGLQVDGVAACRLAWQWFNADHTVYPYGDDDLTPEEYKRHYIDRLFQEPLAVRLAGEYDIWDKRDPRAEVFQHGLRSVDLDEVVTCSRSVDGASETYEQSIWQTLLWANGADGGLAGYQVKHLLSRGEAVQYAKQQEDVSIIKAQGFTVVFEGLTFLALNTPRCNSLSFAAGVLPEHDGLMGFNWTGKDWRVSLYHVPHKTDIDLSAIAVKFGGGGHRGACGFRCERLPFIGA